MSNHTPGPWEVLGTDGDEWVISRRDTDGKRRTLAHVYQRADARLIAEAPNTLEALKRCRAGTITWAEVDAALAKAEGRTQ